VVILLAKLKANDEGPSLRFCKTLGYGLVIFSVLKSSPDELLFALMANPSNEGGVTAWRGKESNGRWMFKIDSRNLERVRMNGAMGNSSEHEALTAKELNLLKRR
jgi:hypothetical protein